MLLTNGKVLDASFQFADWDILVQDSRIAGLYPRGSAPASAEEQTLDLAGRLVLPGFVDIHTHGCAGRDAGEGKRDALVQMSQFYAAHGVTTFLPTTMTVSHEALCCAAEAVRDAVGEDLPGASVGGLYLEGPYFSETYCGAQNPAYLRAPSISEFERLYEASGGTVRVISLAPELPGAIPLIEAARGRAAVAMGHTDADYETARQAIAAGVSILTHTCNAMRPLHHREPGALGAALDSGIFCELICDGVHVHPAMVRLLYRMAGEGRIAFISDSLSAAGMADGEYALGGQRVCVRDGRATLPGGAIAGSTANLLLCVKQAVAFGIPLAHAARMASYNPARAAGLLDRGCIAAGMRADLIVLGPDLALDRTMVGGRIVWEADHPFGK